MPTPSRVHIAYVFIWILCTIAACGDADDATPETGTTSGSTSTSSSGSTSSGSTSQTSQTTSATSQTTQTSTTSETTSPTPLCDLPTVDRGERLLGLDLLNTAEVENFNQNLAHADTLGVNFIALHVLWSQIETDTEAYTDPFGAIEILHDVAVERDMKFSLTIRPIDLTGKTIPADLEGTRFNDPAMIERFKRLLDYVFTLVDAETLTSIQLGNEIDGFNTSQEHPDFWSDYGSFLFEMVQSIHTEHPGVQVGFTVTYHGATDSPLAQAGVFDAYAEVVDLVGITYYPQNAQFEVDGPEHAFEAFDAMANLYGDTPIYLQEIGYQTADIAKSSEEAQAQFFCNVFQAWDEHREKIPAMNIVRLHDVSVEQARELAGPYGLETDAFVDYLRTLGIRRWDGNGEAKPAFDVIRGETEKRGW